jgi:hypothetical protein
MAMPAPAVERCPAFAPSIVDNRRSYVPIADHDELPQLPIASAARPSGNFENIAQFSFGQRVRSKLTYGPQPRSKPIRRKRN